MSAPRLLAVGGAHVDRRGLVEGAHVPGASNPGRMREDVGGGAFNALRMAVRRGVSGSIVSLRGGDAAGEAVAAAILEAGIVDMSAVFLDRATPSYTAILDRGGDVVTALADMALYEIAFDKQLRRRAIRDAVAEADAIMCDANLPAEAVSRLAGMVGHTPLFAIAISPAKVGRLGAALDRLDCLFMNAREARVLAGLDARAEAASAIARLRTRGLARGVVTNGADSCLFFDRSGVSSLAPPRTGHVADVTGAGDALAGATIAALMDGTPLEPAVREGLAGAMLAIESDAASPAPAPRAFEAALALVGRAERVA